MLASPDLFQCLYRTGDHCSVLCISPPAFLHPPPSTGSFPLAAPPPMNFRDKYIELRAWYPYFADNRKSLNSLPSTCYASGTVKSSKQVGFIMPIFEMRKWRLARDGVALCISLVPGAPPLERAVRAHLCHLFQALARSSLARMLTLCLQGLGVSEILLISPEGIVLPS